MPSRSIARLDAINRPLIAGVHEVAEEVGGHLRERFSALLEAGEQEPDWALIQRLAGRLLATNSRRLLDLDQDLEQGRSRDKQMRAKRDQLSEVVRAALRSARFLVDESVGKKLGAGLFRWRNLSKLNAISLILVAREMIGSLRSVPLETPNQPATGKPEVEAVAIALEAAADRLEAHLEILEPSVKRETYAVGMKEKEHQETRATQLETQDFLVGIYRVAGQKHLAARLRPKRRKGRAAREAIPPTEGEEAE
jgi:hypothetical protein